MHYLKATRKNKMCVNELKKLEKKKNMKETRILKNSYLYPWNVFNNLFANPWKIARQTENVARNFPLSASSSDVTGCCGMFLIE